MLVLGIGFTLGRLTLRPVAAFVVAAAMLLTGIRHSHATVGDLIADGVTAQSSFSDSTALALGPATFGRAAGIAIDQSTSPNRAYVSDSMFHRILGWSDVDALVNGAPADIVIGQPDFNTFGCNRQITGLGTPTLSTVCYPAGLAVDSSGRLFVADSGNARVLVFTDPFATDQVADFVLKPTNTGPYFIPKGVAVDAAGHVFIADTTQCRVLELDSPLTTDLAADRVYGQPDFLRHDCNVSANLYFPESVALDSSGNLFVGSNAWFYEFDDALGSDTAVDRRLGTNLCNGGPETAATTCAPIAVATDAAGRLYVGDAGNNRVLEFDSPLTVSQASRVFGQAGFTGPGDQFIDTCNTGGPSASSLCLRKLTPLPAGGAGIDNAAGVALDEAGRLYVADGWNHRVVRYDAPLSDSVADLVLGHAAMDDVRFPVMPIEAPQIALQGNTLLVIEPSNSRILIYPQFGYSFDTPVAALGQPDIYATGCNNGGLNAGSLCNPSAAFIDASNRLWVADSGNHRVLEYDAPWLEYDSTTQQDVVHRDATRVFGQATFTSNTCGAGAGGLCDPRGIAVDARDTLYISDSGNNRIVHHENPLADTTTAEGVYGQADFSGTACNAGGLGAGSLCDPRGLVADSAGNLFIADHGNNRVLVYTDVFTNGGGADRVFGQNGSPTSAACGAGPDGLCSPTGVALDRGGNLLIADSGNDRVLKYDAPLAGDTAADLVFGQPDFGTTGCNTGGVSDHSLCQPSGVAVSSADGYVLIADAGNDRVLRFDAPYCVDDFALTPQTPPGILSRPYATRLRVTSGVGASDDEMKITGRLVLLENDGNFRSNEAPLVTLSGSSGFRYQEQVPWATNERVTASGGIWSFDYRDQPYQGIDYYRVITSFLIPGNDALPQRDRIRYHIEAVGLDLSAFTDPQVTLQLQYKSMCFRAQLTCTSTATGRRCKPSQ